MVQTTSQSRGRYLAIYLALLNSNLRRVEAEEVSILQLASVSTALDHNTPNGDVFLNGSFKSHITTDEQQNPVSIQVNFNLPKAEKVLTVFGMATYNQAARIGESRIYLVNESTRTLSKSGIYDTGIFQLDTPIEATGIIFERNCCSWNEVYPLQLSHMRVYQTTNLLQYGATFYYQTPAQDDSHQAENLITNLESRSSTNLYNARISSASNSQLAGYESCYVTTSANIAIDEDLMSLVLDFQQTHFIHNVLIVDGIGAGSAWSSMSAYDKRNFLQNFEIYVGNNRAVATKNQLCPGGPFLDIDDASNYSEDPNTSNYSNARPWNYGVEIWCNLEGRYLHIVSNLAHQASETYTQKICNLGVFGTIYLRDTALPSNFFVQFGQNHFYEVSDAKITVEHIYADPTRPIGNILDIQVRLTTSLPVTIARTSSEYILTIDLSGLAVKSYSLKIESFDDNSVNKVALKTDTVYIRVIPPELGPPTNFVRNEINTHTTRVWFSWSRPAEVSSSSYVRYEIEMDDGNGGAFSVVRRNQGNTAYAKNVSTTGATYRFRVRSTNGIDYSVYSSTFSIIAGTVPYDQGAPTTSIGGDVIIPYLIVTWPEPFDFGGLSIGYRVTIRTSIGTYEKDVTDCEAESNSTIIEERQCTFSIAVLRHAPFNLVDSDLVYAQVTAFNAVGDSVTSLEGGGATIPILIIEPDAPTSLVKVSATQTQAVFSWSAPTFDGGSDLIDYSIEMDDYEIATRETSTNYTQIGLTPGKTYTFKVRARNRIGFSSYSTGVSIIAGTVPYYQGAPTTSVIDEYQISISWDLPADQGGLPITGYCVDIMTAAATFELDLTDCDAQYDQIIISSRTCTVKVDTTLRVSPFSLADLASISARVTAINILGESLESEEGNGAKIPIKDVQPDPPTNFIRNEENTSKTQVAFTWNPPSNDGGDQVIDYQIEMDDGNGGSYSEVATGITSTSYTMTGLQTLTTYRFQVKARNSIGYSVYSSAFSIIAATVPQSQGAPTTSIEGEENNFPYLKVTWPEPSDQGGFPIDGYKVKIKTSSKVFYEEITYCDAQRDSTIISNKSCSIPVFILRQAPFNLDNEDSVYAQVTSFNSIGDSEISYAGNGATIPIIKTVPDPPTSFVQNEESTSKTQIVFTWSAPVKNAGTELLDYSIQMYDDNEKVYYTVAESVISRSHTQSDLTANTTYEFRIRSRNVIGASSYSSVFYMRTESEKEIETELKLASFEYELQPLTIKQDQPMFQWQLPPIIEGTEALLEIRVKPDVQLNSFISFDEKTRTIIFSGTARSIQRIAGLRQKIYITLEDIKGNLVEYTQLITIQASISISEEQESELRPLDPFSEKECEIADKNGNTNCDTIKEEDAKKETISDEPTQAESVTLAQDSKFSIQPIEELKDQAPEEKTKLEIEKMEMNSLGELTIKFNKDIMKLPIETQQSQQSIKGQAPGQNDIQDAIKVKDLESQEEYIIKVKVENADDDYEKDKSIGSVTFSQKQEVDEPIQKLTLDVAFNDIKTITSDIREPDALIVELLQQPVYLSRQLQDAIGRIETQTQDPNQYSLSIAQQMTKEEHAELVQMFETAANVGVALSIWQIIICIVFNKILNSMWVLINAAQFLVYIGMWSINYSTGIAVLVKEIKRIFQGEYLEDLQIGHKLSSLLGFKSNSDVEAPEEKIGDERLGSNNIWANFGITFIIAFVVFILLIIMVLIVIQICLRRPLSQMNEKRLEKLKTMFFFNPLIRFAFLGALKFNFSSMLAFKSEESSITQTFVAVVIFILITFVIPGTLTMQLYRNRQILHEKRTVNTIGTIYQGRRLQSTTDKRRVWIYPITYFCRRTIFIGACVFLLDHPNVQMIVHQFLTMATLVYICNDDRMFENDNQKFIEIITEVLLLLASMLMQQFMRTPQSEEMTQNLEISVFVALGLLLLLNIIFLIYSVVINRKERKRSKAIEAAKIIYQQASEAINEKNLQKGLIENASGPDQLQQQPSLQVIKEVSMEEDSSLFISESSLHSDELSLPQVIPIAQQESPEASKNFLPVVPQKTNNLPLKNQSEIAVKHKPYKKTNQKTVSQETSLRDLVQDLTPDVDLKEAEADFLKQNQAQSKESQEMYKSIDEVLDQYDKIKVGHQNEEEKYSFESKQTNQ